MELEKWELNYLREGHSHLSEDVNLTRYLNNPLTLDQDTLKNILAAFATIFREMPLGIWSD